MKRLLVLVVITLFTCLANAQSAATVLSTLRTKGTTKVGGTQKYENYIPLLVENGVLDYSVLPTNNIMGDVTTVINMFGSEYDRALIDALATNVDARFLSEFQRYDWLAHMMYSNAVVTAGANVPDNEIDPVYLADKSALQINIFTNALRVAFGKGALADADDAWQLGTGTNTVEGTLKYKKTTLVGPDGFIPESSIPWAVSKTSHTEATNELLSLDGGNMRGDVSFDGLVEVISITNTPANPVVLDGVITRSVNNYSNAVFTGRVVYNLRGIPGNELIRIYDNRVIELDTDSGTNIYTFATSNGRIDLSNGYLGLTMTLDKSLGTIHYVLVTDNGESYEYTIAVAADEIKGVNSVVESIVKPESCKNPHGITLDYIKEPTDYVDLKSPSGYIFRIQVSDSGEITSTRLR